MEERRTPARSQVETSHIVRPGDLNDAGRLFGGVLMSWIDEISVLVARKHAQMPITTAAVDNLRFLRGAYLKDTVVLKGRVTYVGRTSMEIKVETYVEHLTGQRELINRAFLTVIGLDENDRPKEVPRLELETEADRTEWEQAKLRREIRDAQHKDGFYFYGAE